MQIERRWLATEFELRSRPTGLPLIEGYAAKFNTRSQNLGGFVEQIAPGTFTKTIQESDVRALINHDPNFVLGRNKAETLRLAQDNTGLYYAIEPPDTAAARDLIVSMERGDISQSSFGFRTISDEWGFTEQDFPLRTLTEAQLLDVSPVTYPAYLDTESGVSRALTRLAEKRGLDSFDVADLGAIIRGDHTVAGVATEEAVEEPVATTPTTDFYRMLLEKKASPVGR